MVKSLPIKPAVLRRRGHGDREHAQQEGDRDEPRY